MDRNDEHDRRRALLLAELMGWKFKGVDILVSQNPRAIGIVTIARAIRQLDEDMGFALAPCDKDMAAQSRDAARYRFLRSRDLDTIGKGGVFAGLTPDNMVLNEEHLDAAVDVAMAAGEAK